MPQCGAEWAGGEGDGGAVRAEGGRDRQGRAEGGVLLPAVRRPAGPPAPMSGSGT